MENNFDAEVDAITTEIDAIGNLAPLHGRYPGQTRIDAVCRRIRALVRGLIEARELVEARENEAEEDENPCSVLLEAHHIVTGARQQDYGPPARGHARTAQMWSDYLGVVITPRQVCMLNILQKISRDAHRPKRDNLVDIAGWAENARDLP